MGCGSGSLAGELSPDCYLGIEVDPFSLQSASSNFPEHSFQKALPIDISSFDTIVALAVIEHVKSPELFLIELSSRLNSDKLGKIVITTPHPSMKRIYDFGASIGVFSEHANEEHEELLDHSKLEAAGTNAGLHLVLYRSFLFGANQLAVFEKKS